MNACGKPSPRGRGATLRAASVVVLIALGAASATSATPPYQIANGKVDDATYRGWRAYHSACHTCHGVDAVGTSVAPSLVERVRDMSEKRFTVKVIRSYRIVMGSDEFRGDDQTALLEQLAEDVMRAEHGQLMMPAWGDDAAVKPRVHDLYVYLRARADGALGPGEPARKNTNTSSPRP